MACMLCARCRQQNKVPLVKKITLLAEGSMYSASHKKYRRQAESNNASRRSGGQPDRSAPLQSTPFAKPSDPPGGMIAG